MKIEINTKPKNPVIIEGFPGFGYVSTIATEFLIKHLNAKKIGRIVSPKLTPMVVIHNSKIIDSIEIYYNKKYNIIILRALTNISGAEWEIAEAIYELAKKVKAKEIISLEGVASKKVSESKIYYYSNAYSKKNKFNKIKIENLKEGIIMGVSGALILKAENKKIFNIPTSCIFVDANFDFPDSRAAGEIIKVLDSYLGLEIDYKPLFKTAEEFETKLRELFLKAKKIENLKQKKQASYYG